MNTSLILSSSHSFLFPSFSSSFLIFESDARNEWTKLQIKWAKAKKTKSWCVSMFSLTFIMTNWLSRCLQSVFGQVFIQIWVQHDSVPNPNSIRETKMKNSQNNTWGWSDTPLAFTNSYFWCCFTTLCTILLFCCLLFLYSVVVYSRNLFGALNAQTVINRPSFWWLSLFFSLGVGRREDVKIMLPQLYKNRTKRRTVVATNFLIGLDWPAMEMGKIKSY